MHARLYTILNPENPYDPEPYDPNMSPYDPKPCP